jgi:hypothetical protein
LGLVGRGITNVEGHHGSAFITEPTVEPFDALGQSYLEWKKRRIAYDNVELEGP